MKSAFNYFFAKILTSDLVTIADDFDPHNFKQNHGYLGLLKLPTMNLCD